MKKFLLLLLITIATPVYAEWKLLIVTLPGDSYYVDPATKTTGDKPQVTTMLNGRSQETRTSNKVVWEADCKRSECGRSREFVIKNVIFRVRCYSTIPIRAIRCIPCPAVLLKNYLFTCVDLNSHAHRAEYLRHGYDDTY